MTSEGLLADGAGGFLRQPLVDAVTVELVVAWQAVQHRPWHKVLQADGALAFLVRAHARRAHNHSWQVLYLLRGRSW